MQAAGGGQLSGAGWSMKHAPSPAMPFCMCHSAGSSSLPSTSYSGKRARELYLTLHSALCTEVSRLGLFVRQDRYIKGSEQMG